jgi:hypothetical protein
MLNDTLELNIAAKLYDKCQTDVNNHCNKSRPPRFIRDSSLIRPVAFDKCLFLKIPRIVCPSSDFNLTHILVYATKNTYED